MSSMRSLRIEKCRAEHLQFHQIVLAMVTISVIVKTDVMMIVTVSYEARLKNLYLFCFQPIPPVSAE